MMKKNIPEKFGQIKLIIGLGNPGTKYAGTRHNVGFLIVAALAQKWAARLAQNKKFAAEIAEIRNGNQKIILMRPLTFMNDSGRAVRSLSKFYNLPPSDLLVVHDEVDLPLGALRLAPPGAGTAGHKGVESIINALGRTFSRLRVGIENRTAPRIPKTDEFVLQNFTAAEKKLLDTKIVPAALLEIQKFIK